MTDYHLNSLTLWSLIFKIDSLYGLVARLDSPSICYFTDCKTIDLVLIERKFLMTARGCTPKSSPTKKRKSKP